MKRVLRILFKVLFWVAAFTALPMWVASILDTEPIVFVIAFDIVLAILCIAANDYKRGVTPSDTDILFPFPFHKDK